MGVDQKLPDVTLFSRTILAVHIEDNDKPYCRTTAIMADHISELCNLARYYG